MNQGVDVHVVIGGCGRVGSTLARNLSEDGHTVVVIDKNPRAFRRLGEDFGGRTLTGIVFDRDLLEEAGIRRAQAFVAVTSGDNSNVVSARTAKDRFGVERVVARIYDPERASIYERLGLTTIASARWTTEAVTRALLPEGDRVEGSVGPGGSGDVVMITLTVPTHVHALPATLAQKPGEAVLVAITRSGSTMLPIDNAVLEGGDQVHLAVNRDTVDEARQRVEDLENH
jgi:trk system potassium uptake protein TrkA